MSIRGRLRIRTRLRAVASRIRPPKPKPLILLYHRIANAPIDHWKLAVSPAHFEEHLSVLRRTRHPLPLAEFVGGLITHSLRQDAVALTFDDGYVDNLVAGKPRLVAAEVPATVFLATGYLDRPEAYWWDELASFIIPETGPQSFEIMIGGKSMQIDFGAGRDGNTPGASLARRRQALWKLRQALRLLEEAERRLIMSKLRSVFGKRDHCANLGRAMTGEEVQTLVMDGLITIGAHTVTHPVLTELGDDARNREIIESKYACEALTEGPVAGFAYPYGELNANSRAAVVAAGFGFACSVRHGPTVASSDVFALPRFHVCDCDGDVFEKALRSASNGP
jgi:peptidoglycan/xylan/chitin deacetylase (PgdA/CDA1 family)